MAWFGRETNEGGTPSMSKERPRSNASGEGIISIVGPGMVVVGDCETDGTLRVEGTVRGSISAGKAVVVGKEGVVDGDIRTEDAVVAGHVTGTLVAGSRLELQSTSRIDGDVRARRMRLEEGALLNGTVLMGEGAAQKTIPPVAAVSAEEILEEEVPEAVSLTPQIAPGSGGQPNDPGTQSPHTGGPPPTPPSAKGGTPSHVNGPAAGVTVQTRPMEPGLQE